MLPVPQEKESLKVFLRVKPRTEHELIVFRYFYSQGCGSGLIQYGSGILAQSTTLATIIY
jgi:hypothetical protein